MAARDDGAVGIWAEGFLDVVVCADDLLAEKAVETVLGGLLEGEDEDVAAAFQGEVFEGGRRHGK